MNKNGYEIKNTFKSNTLFEANIEYNGRSYLVIYGKHINGHFCCIMNRDIVCEMSDPSDTFYNKECLMNAKLKEKEAENIALAIKELAGGIKA